MIAKSQQELSSTILAPRKSRIRGCRSENGLSLNNSNTRFGIMGAMKNKTIPLVSRMGSPITLTSKPDKEGYLKAVFHFEKGDSPREIHMSDIRSENGLPEILDVIASLPDFPKP